MKTLQTIAEENPLYYANMALKANTENKSLSVENDELVLIETPQPKLSPQEHRALAYPSIAEQFDMMYWDKVNGTNNWQEAIAKVKQEYPKDIK